MYKLIRHGGDDIKQKPRPQVPQSNPLRLIDQYVARFIEIRDEERQHNVNAEEAIDDVIRDVEREPRYPEDTELERRYPRRVEHQYHQKRLPSSANFPKNKKNKKTLVQNNSAAKINRLRSKEEEEEEEEADL